MPVVNSAELSGLVTLKVPQEAWHMFGFRGADQEMKMVIEESEVVKLYSMLIRVIG